LSNYSGWDQKAHAGKWLLFPQNTGIHLSMDETSLSNGELYTVVTSKSAKGRKGSLVSIVSGTRADEVNAVLDKIPQEQLHKVEEVTLDMSDSMRKIVRHSFPCVQRVIDRFHVQKLAFDAPGDAHCASLGCHK
jgi:transposase